MRGGPVQSGFVRHAYRPFDNRWLYWEAETKLLDEKRTDYKPHVFAGNKWISFNKRPQKGESEPRACATEHIGCHDLIGNATCFFSLWLYDYAPSFREHELPHRPNLTPAAMRYLELLGARIEDLFHHVLARPPRPGLPPCQRRGAEAWGGRASPFPAGPMETPPALLRRWPNQPHAAASWPSCSTPTHPSPASPKAHCVRRLPPSPYPPPPTDATWPATTLHSPPAGATSAQAAQSCPARAASSSAPTRRRNAPPLAGATPILGETTYDIYLNARAYWRNVPAGVWTYKLGGYQVLKKWLSYRERTILRRPLKPDEVQHFAETARRIAAILLETHQKTP